VFEASKDRALRIAGSSFGAMFRYSGSVRILVFRKERGT
jgi:hypothetical protein